MDKIDEDLLLKYLQNECSEVESDRILQWINDADENAQQLFRLEQVFHSGRLFHYSKPLYIEKSERRLMRRIAESKTQKRSGIQMYWRYVAVAAVLLILFIPFKYFADKNSADNYVTYSVTAHAPVQKIELPDGSTVWLNRLSTLRYRKHFDEKFRKVELDGEAYFEVSKNVNRPFIVCTDDLNVKVLGTSFNIRSRKDLCMADATLFEGSVEVCGSNNEGMIVLSPGQKAELNKTTGQLHVKQINLNTDVKWHDDVIRFDKATIFEITAVLERFYDVKIIISPDVDNNTYSGVLHNQSTIDSVLMSLKNSIPIEYKKQGNKIYIKQSKI